MSSGARVGSTLTTVGAALLVAVVVAPVAASRVGVDMSTRRAQPELNLALGGVATASQSEEDGILAIDGDAATQWCSASDGAELDVTLPAVQRVNSIAITWARTSPADATRATIFVSREGRQWERVWSGTPGEPMGESYRLTRIELGGRRANLGAARVHISADDATPPCVGELRLFAYESDADRSIRGADISFTPQVEAAGGSYSDERGTRPLEDILVDHGANYARLRLWVDPPPGYSDLESVLGMARRVKAAGMKLLIDFHYSDFWADPSKQFIPAAWAGQDLDTLAETVETYTRDVAGALSDQGTPPDMVQIGNEVVGGMLWPEGQIYRDDGEHWAEFATLVKAGIDGAHQGVPAGHELRTMIHIDRGGSNADSRYFYDHLLAEGVDFDVIGLSFYPFWHGSLTDMRTNINDLATRYAKDIVIVETAYPWTLGNGDDLGNFVTSPDQLPVGYPAGPEGQEMFVRDVYAALRHAPDGRGLGFVYWEPEWLPVVGWQPGDGNPNDNLTLFDWEGRSLPSLWVFGSG